MKRLFFNLIAFVLLASFSSCGYNSMVNKEEAIEGQWAQVEAAYQRRLDLIPNLVSTVQASTDAQKEILTGVMEARAKATAINLNVDNLTEENIAKFQAAQDGLSSALNRLMMVTENYPKVDIEAYKALMFELEQTENRIGVERRKFNEAVQDYNSYIRRFPNNMTAGMFGFEKKAYFHAQEGADKAPKVEFNKK